MEDITIFLPCRSGSERVINKNTKDFAGFKGGLLYLKLTQLLEINLDIKIILSTNDKKVIEIGGSFNDSRIIIDNRPNHLCLSSTLLQDLIMYVPQIVSTNHVFWLHTTTPLVNSQVYEDAIRRYFEILEEGFDSIMSVSRQQSFLWDDDERDIINYDRKAIKYPRTQDLKPLFEINHAFYAMSIDNYVRYEDRIGKHPYLIELSKIQSIDVDDNEDFEIAEIIYKSIKF